MKKTLRKPVMKKAGALVKAYFGENAGIAIVCGYNF